MLHTYIIGKLFLKVFVDCESKEFEFNKIDTEGMRALQLQFANKVMTLGMYK